MKYFLCLFQFMCLYKESILPINTAKYSSFNTFLNNNNYTYNTGIDYRYPIHSDNDIDELIEQININYHKKRVLDTLISPNIATLQKIDIIKKYDIFDNKMGTNILAGGLMDDFNFEL